MALPYAAGHLAERSGTRAVLFMILAACALVALLEISRNAEAARTAE